MKELDRELNTILVDTFRSILKVEEAALKRDELADLSISEMHLPEAIGKSPDGRTVSDIASELMVTLPSVTVAINKLAKKGYVEKFKSNHDGRVVYVRLTKLGKKIDSVHRYFHQQMIRAISSRLEEEEKAVLYKGVKALNEFFRVQAEQLESR